MSAVMPKNNSVELRTTHRWRTSFGCLAALALAGYLLQSFTPIRLTEDAIIYLTVANSAIDGQGFTYQGALTSSPLGYPVIVVLLAKVGLARSWCLNIFNVLAIIAGLAGVRSIALSRGLSRERLAIVTLTCVYSFAMIKHAALPLADISFFGVTVAAVALAEKAALKNGQSAWIYWAFSLLLAAVGLSLRVAGIVGVVALLFESWKAAIRGSRKARIAATVVFAATGAAAVAGLAAWVTRPGASTGTPVVKILGVFTEKPLFSILSDHFLDLGEIVLNLPLSKVPSGLHPAFYAAGFFTIALVGAILYRSRGNWSPGKTFLVCYSTMVFLIAYTPGSGMEPRYWLPALPLLAMELLSKENPLIGRAAASRMFRIGAGCYGIYFVLMGSLALGYSSLLTLDQGAFLSAPAIASWKPEYEEWMLHRSPAPGSAADARILPLLKTFGGDR